MKRLLALLLTLVALTGQTQTTNPNQQGVPPKTGVVSKSAQASAVVSSQANQPIYLTLEADAKPQQTTGTNYTLIAAIVAALAGLTSAGIAAFIAIKSKDKDYKNDYYKRIIDKRIKALEVVESIISQFQDYILVNHKSSTIKCHSYFVNNIEQLLSNKFDVFGSETPAFAMWCSAETNTAISAFVDSVMNIVLEGRKLAKLSEFPENTALNCFAAKFNEIEQNRNKVEKSITHDMHILYDVESFLLSKH